MRCRVISVEELARKGARVKKGEKPEVITRILLSLRADDMALPVVRDAGGVSRIGLNRAACGHRQAEAR